MKKVLFALVAMLTLVFTGCKVENSKVTVAVEDQQGLPVAQRGVIYADLASVIIDAVIPSPEEIATGMSDVWNYAQTNALGYVEIQIPLGVAKMKYEFAVFDLGKNDWIEQTVELHRGQNEEIKFVVQQ